VKILVTAGPTREPIDPVRYLSNRSSGKMGYAIAEAALESGEEVTLISGPVSLPAPEGARIIRVVTSDQMHQAVHQHLDGCDVLIMCAAVADYKPVKASPHKIKKGAAALILELIPTRDILASVAAQERDFLVVGFAAETNDLQENARKKLLEKNCDLVVGNDVSSSEIGMDSDENEVTIFFRNGEMVRIPRSTKRNVARELVKIVSNMREKCLTKKTW
jgi:phosphopantothenoylcysteine decarboxylase / phosphopantothenate---cysteine ligase